MPLKPSERATLVKEIGKRLATEERPLIDATFEAFSLPTLEWEGSDLSYTLYCLREASEQVLLELAEHVGYIESKPTDAEPRFWKQGYFRLFISHLATHKRFAAKLKEELDGCSVSCFVAHNDIMPTKEWLNEIEMALSSCEAMIALLHPKFHESKWTDQEIGFVMGRGLPVFTVRCGEDPYGFIGKFQAFNGNNKDISVLTSEIFDALRKNKQTKKRMSAALVDGFVESNSYRDAIDRAGRLQGLTVWDASYAPRLRLAVKRNRQVTEAIGVPDKVDRLIKKWTVTKS
jgi:hypothetical protein